MRTLLIAMGSAWFGALVGYFVACLVRAAGEADRR